MARIPSDVHDLLRRQHGVVTTGQLRVNGVSRGMGDSLIRHGDLEPLMRGVFRSPSVELTELSRCAAVSLAHPLVAISGPTAGRLWGFRRMGQDRRVHVIAPRHWRATTERWCVAYRTDAIHRDDVVCRPDGIRLTTRERTALDLARSTSNDDRLLSVIEQAAHNGGLRDGDLRAVAVDWAQRRAWVRSFLAQVDRRLDGAGAESEPEVRVGIALAAAGVTGLVRQHPLVLNGFGAVRFDLAVPSRKWALEVDVFPTHRETVGRQQDQRRDRAAATAGWRVRRITESEYRNALDESVLDLARDVAFRPVCRLDDHGGST